MKYAFGLVALVLAAALVFWIGSGGVFERKPAAHKRPVVAGKPAMAPLTSHKDHLPIARSVNTRDVTSEMRVSREPSARGLKPLSLPEPPWGEKLHELTQKAKDNPRVAFELARMLFKCARTPATTQQYKKALLDLREYHHFHGYYVDNVVPHVELLKDRFEACKGITRDIRLRYQHWLTKAAENGSVFAQVRYGNFPLPKGLENPAVPPSAYLSQKGIEKYRHRALQYLDMAVAQGNADGMFWRGQAALAGVITSKNVFDAYAYIYAANIVFKRNGIDRDLDALLGRIKRKIRPRKVAKARKKGKTLLNSSKCCSYLKTDS